MRKAQWIVGNISAQTYCVCALFVFSQVGGAQLGIAVRVKFDSWSFPLDVLSQGSLQVPSLNLVEWERTPVRITFLLNGFHLHLWTDN